MSHGRHIKVLGYGDPGRLRSVGGLEAMLEDLVDRLGMRCLSSPHMYEVEEEILRLGAEPFEDEGGVTGVAVLSTSHCAIHTWPLRSFFVMDVYSCRDFDPEAVRELVTRHFDAHTLRLTDLSFSLDPELEPEAARNVPVPKPVARA